LDIPAKEAISKDFSVGVDIVSTPAGNRDCPFGNPGVLRGYFSTGLPMPEPVPMLGGSCLKKKSLKAAP
jgi:hypothetical protein